ncbi:hypothetical protein E4U60_000334 [Claviceps pazoutovae]|uniref:Uncharacterized protein n=1 Tax=Claviceps pazoutovae TaxID=1649127 RepID=A0A9P7MDS8_9HYPO|nr:hypothetical protein E4U60_000334 [Claviceps pazoutovae]
MAVVVKRDDDVGRALWDISTYQTTKDETKKGMSGKIMCEIAREAIIQREIPIGVVADLRDSLDALDGNAIALIESHNELAKKKKGPRGGATTDSRRMRSGSSSLSGSRNSQFGQRGLVLQLEGASLRYAHPLQVFRRSLVQVGVLAVRAGRIGRFRCPNWLFLGPGNLKLELPDRVLLLSIVVSPRGPFFG